MTPHIEARPDDFASTCLLPGDPLRAQYIADTFLSDVRQVNSVRNMLGFTGFYQGVPVSVMGSGMGIPSISIYAKELITEYGVKNLIRVGSCGAISKNVHIRDILIGMGACTDWQPVFRRPVLFPQRHTLRHDGIHGGSRRGNGSCWALRSRRRTQRKIRSPSHSHLHSLRSHPYR